MNYGQRLVPEPILKDLKGLRDKRNNINLDELINESYEDLISNKTKGKLIPGAKYVIEGWTTKLASSITFARSVGNVFDLILTAKDQYSFEPIAYAKKNKDSDYFEDKYINKWVLWYNIDNDTDLCDYIDDTCQGYIYKFIDENDNELYYDFKNIQFKRYKITDLEYKDYYPITGQYLMSARHTSEFDWISSLAWDTDDFVWRWTFSASDDLTKDLSNRHTESSDYNSCRYVKQVKIGEALSNSPYRGKKVLGNNVFISPNIVCDFIAGSQSINNTYVSNADISYNYYGAMWRNNIYYVGDNNHNNSAECFEKNLIFGSFSWNRFISDHISTCYLKHFELNSITTRTTSPVLRIFTTDNSLKYTTDQYVQCCTFNESGRIVTYAPLFRTIFDNCLDITINTPGGGVYNKVDFTQCNNVVITSGSRAFGFATIENCSYVDFTNPGTSVQNGWKIFSARGSAAKHIVVDMTGFSLNYNNCIKYISAQGTIDYTNGAAKGFYPKLWIDVYDLDTTNTVAKMYRMVWSNTLNNTFTTNLTRKSYWI